MPGGDIGLGSVEGAGSITWILTTLGTLEARGPIPAPSLTLDWPVPSHVLHL